MTRVNQTALDKIEPHGLPMLNCQDFELKPLMSPIVPSFPAFSQNNCRLRLATSILSESKLTGNSLTYFLNVAGSRSGKHSSDRPDSTCSMYFTHRTARSSDVLNFRALVLSAGAGMRTEYYTQKAYRGRWRSPR